MPLTQPVLLGTVASLLAGLATGAGCIPVLAGQTIPDRVRDALLGMAAGVMMAATFFSLIEPAMNLFRQSWGGSWSTAGCLSLGIVLGASIVSSLEWILANAYGWNSGSADKLPIEKVWIFVLAVTLHNIPEGLAVGVSFGTGDIAQGISVALGIGLQNMPEGLAVALALVAHGYDRRQAFSIGVLTGLVEPPVGLLGAAAVAVAQPLLPWALAIAAGAMLFVIADEVVPQSHAHGYGAEATGGFIAGFVLMTVLDVALG